MNKKTSNNIRAVDEFPDFRSHQFFLLPSKSEMLIITDPNSVSLDLWSCWNNWTVRVVTEIGKFLESFQTGFKQESTSLDCQYILLVMTSHFSVLLAFIYLL